jgi:peroxiredoxin (alkyl hydroperoxide reductase subunit C)
MLTVGDRFPDFSLVATVSREPGKEFATITGTSYPHKWRDFTFVCPTEIAGFGAKAAEFAARDAVVLGASGDTQYVHLAWRERHPALKDLPIPMLADTKRELATALGILEKTEGVPLRATFLVDPTGTIRWVSVNDLNVGRNVDEVLRTLDALRTESLTPCNWVPGDATLSAA